MDQFYVFFRQITSLADFGTLVAMGASIAMSLIISLIIYIRCKSRPGNPLLQLFSLFTFPIIVFFAIAFFKLSPLVAPCENDAVTIECVESDTISGVIDLYKARGEKDKLQVTERVRSIHSTKSFMMALSKKYTLVALLFSILYPLSLLFYTRRHIKS